MAADGVLDLRWIAAEVNIDRLQARRNARALMRLADEVLVALEAGQPAPIWIAGRASRFEELLAKYNDALEQGRKYVGPDASADDIVDAAYAVQNEGE